MAVTDMFQGDTSLRWMARASIVMVIALALCIVARFAILRSMRESATITLPGDAGTVTFVHERQEIIPSMDVGCDRKMIYCRPGQQIRSWKLPSDPGYNMRINVYWISNGDKPFVRFEDPGDEYLLDLNANTLHLIVTVQGVKYAGPMGDGDTSIWAYGPADPSEQTWTVRVGKNPAVPLATIVSDANGVYIGEIWCRRFTSAADSPEIPIKKLFAN
jgi:hypothetical protein